MHSFSTQYNAEHFW